MSTFGMLDVRHVALHLNIDNIAGVFLKKIVTKIEKDKVCEKSAATRGYLASFIN
jgi:hypothetical protein